MPPATSAVSLPMVAAIHVQQYYDAYFSAVPTIGRLLMLNIVASVTGLPLLAPVTLLGRRAGGAIQSQRPITGA